MPRSAVQKLTALALFFCFSWLCIRYLLPLLLPFLLGTGLALAAEPAVSFASGQLRLPRGVAAVLGVSGMLILFLGLFLLLGTALVRELGALTSILPDLESAVAQGLTRLEDFLLCLASHTADGIRPLLTRSVLGLSQNSTALLDKVVRQLPGIASSILTHVPGSLVTAGTGFLSAFMISARLPVLRDWIDQHNPPHWKQRYLPALRRIRTAVFGWLKAQLKLSAMTFLIAAAGLVILRIPFAPLYALGIALVDAVPLLGTGTVLLPWSLICLLQGNPVLAAGLVAVYAVAALTRSAMEPRLVGKQLGLDPLVTLICLYMGYQFWGLLGMLFAPLMAVAATQAIRQN